MHRVVRRTGCRDFGRLDRRANGEGLSDTSAATSPAFASSSPSVWVVDRRTRAATPRFGADATQKGVAAARSIDSRMVRQMWPPGGVATGQMQVFGVFGT